MEFLVGCRKEKKTPPFLCCCRSGPIWFHGTSLEGGLWRVSRQSFNRPLSRDTIALALVMAHLLRMHDVQICDEK